MAVPATEGGAVVVVVGCVVVVVGDVVLGVEDEGVVDRELFGWVVVEEAGGWVVVVDGEVVVVAELFGVIPGDVVLVLGAPATSELRFKVAALEWNENSPTKPATVPVMTIGARFIRF